MRTFCLQVVLPLLSLLVSSSLCGAENPAWNNLKQLSPGLQVRVVVNGKKSFKGQFQSATDDAIIIRSKGADQTLSRTSVQQVSSRRSGHRGRHALIPTRRPEEAGGASSRRQRRGAIWRPR